MQLGKCPCQRSNESSWKLKCSGCKQIWHTNCANLRSSKAISESVILSLENTWLCPWCFRSQILRPPGHPSCTNETQIFGTALADAVCEKVREDISNEVLPEFQLSVDNLITARLKGVSERVEAQISSIKEDMKHLITLKSTLLTADISEHPPVANLHTNLQPTSLATNPTNHIEDYNESYLSDDEITELNTAFSSMNFSQVNGRGVASFGEDYNYNGAPNLNTKEIPNPLQTIIKKIHDDPLYKDENINQVVINKYTGNTHLPEHSDDEATIRPESHIIYYHYYNNLNLRCDNMVWWPSHSHNIAVSHLKNLQNQVRHVS